MERPLFIFEMANNHQGSVEHGKNIIRALKSVTSGFDNRFSFAVKFQYRDLETFIHPAYKNRLDIKNVKRFQETKLTDAQFEELIAEARDNGFQTICTPFDEISAEKIKKQGFDYIKVASCSFTDWSLLEAVAATRLPAIVSGAASSMEDIENVVGFFRNRNIPLSLMHCVAEYPTLGDKLELNQIDLYRRKFPWVKVGFSTHESPDNNQIVGLAVAKGAEIFEKHVGLATDTISLNGYSANPEQVKSWLSAAAEAFDMCGNPDGRYQPSAKECANLQGLRRGVFIRKDCVAPGILKPEDYYLAFPCVEGQLTAEKLSKYNTIHVKKAMGHDEPVMLRDTELINTKEMIGMYVHDILDLLKRGNIVVPKDAVCTLSHHYGLERFREYGMTMLDCLNREYCKKLLLVLPGQHHPEQYHKEKEEHFQVQYGTMHCILNGEERILTRGESVLIERGMHHAFWSEGGCVIEELSTTHDPKDSYYIDADRFVPLRKTQVYIRQYLE